MALFDGDMVDRPSQKQSIHCLTCNVSSSSNPSSLMIIYSHQSRHNFPETCDVVCAAVVGATEHVPVAVPVVVAVASVFRFARRFWGAAVPVLNQVCNVNVINFLKFSIQNNLSIILHSCQQQLQTVPILPNRSYSIRHYNQRIVRWPSENDGITRFLG